MADPAMAPKMDAAAPAVAINEGFSTPLDVVKKAIRPTIMISCAKNNPAQNAHQAILREFDLFPGETSKNFVSISLNFGQRLRNTPPY